MGRPGRAGTQSEQTCDERRLAQRRDAAHALAAHLGIKSARGATGVELGAPGQHRGDGDARRGDDGRAQRVEVEGRLEIERHDQRVPRQSRLEERVVERAEREDPLVAPIPGTADRAERDTGVGERGGIARPHDVARLPLDATEARSELERQHGGLAEASALDDHGEHRTGPHGAGNGRVQIAASEVHVVLTPLAQRRDGVLAGGPDGIEGIGVDSAAAPAAETQARASRR